MNRKYFYVAILLTSTVHLGCDKTSKIERSGDNTHVNTNSKSAPRITPEVTKKQISRATTAASIELVKALSEALKSGGPRAASEILMKCTEEQLEEILTSTTLNSPLRINGIAALIYANKAGKTGDPKAIEILFGSRIELPQLQEASSIFFRTASESGNLLSPSHYMDMVGSGAKRDKIVESYFATKTQTIDSTITQGSELGFREDTRNALIGAAKSKQWSYTELAPLIDTEYEDLLPLFSLHISRGLRVTKKDAANFNDEWESLKNLDLPTAGKLQAKFLSTIGAIDPNTAISYLESSSKTQAETIISDPSFSKVIQRWTELDPTECIQFIHSSEINEVTRTRLLNTALGKWLSLDSESAGKWVSSLTEPVLYEPAARKIISWLNSKGDTQSASEWEKTLPKK